MVDFKKHLADKRLASRVKAIGQSQTVNLNPTPWVPRERPKKVEPPPPDLADLLDGPSLIRAQRLVHLSVEQKAIQRTARLAEEPLIAELKGILEPLGKMKAVVGETKLAYYPTSRSVISKALLLARGVSPADIAAATVSHQNWTLKLSLPGQEHDTDDSEQ